jgi:xylan 1,4-beta-xylosidase
MKKLITILVLMLFGAYEMFSQALIVQTYCNPINISYRFCIDQPSRREAADPSVVWFRDRYFLFASKSGGYWHSFDLLKWTFIKIDQQLPTEDYAPTVVALNDTLYFLASSSDFSSIYKSGNPLAAKWSIASPKLPMRVWDPCLFVDDDKRMYLYWGCSDVNPTLGVELDYKHDFAVIGTQKNLITANPSVHGWEVMGDYNTLYDKKTWFEGSWMSKHDGKYYLQYAAPGTEYKCYADGYYVSKSPLGPFTYAANNPFSAKPEGFIAGAGHGSTFTDKYGNWWHIATMSISVKHMFERRLGLFPVTFDAQGNMIAHTEFSDLPMIMPKHKYSNVSELFPGWMMLSYKKTGEASSSLAANPISYAFDENIRDYWSAATGNKGEWLSVDLGEKKMVKAVQINFAENNTQLYGRNGIQAQQYLLEYLTDKKTWITLADKTTNTEDLTHQYHLMTTPIFARYLRVTNYRVTGGTFAVSGFRVFGLAVGNKPQKVSSFSYTRSKNDSRTINIQWSKQKNATGYMIRFGVEKDKLYRSYQAYADTAVSIHSLDKGQRYWFAIDAFGESGVTKGDIQECTISPIGFSTSNVTIK